MKVTLIAQTELSTEPDSLRLATDSLLPLDPELYPVDADHLSEFAGRACYQSWNRPNPKTASNKSYLSHILEIGHESVLAHASATFYIEGVSRSLTHELVRHRFLAFSQLSQRYVDESNAEGVMPPVVKHLRDEAMGDETVGDVWQTAFQDAQRAYRFLNAALARLGVPRKQAREAARSVLPNAIETKIVVSGNLRAWRDFLKLRLSSGADAEIRLLAQEILKQLKEIAPNSFQDFKEN